MEKNPAQAVGHIPSGLFIVISGDGKQFDGYLASWVQQISFEPLMITLAIKPGRPAYDFIKDKKAFTINVVGDHEKTYLKHFWKGYDPENNPLDELETSQGDHGGLILNQAKSAIECEIVSSTKPGDHELVVAKVLQTYTLSDDSKPMIHTRKTGLDY